MYTIEFLTSSNQDFSKCNKVFSDLGIRLDKDNRFRASVRMAISDKGLPRIVIKPVRLRKAKPYCGNHPGECQLSNRRKPNATYLEWNDWVAFHKLVNTSLNKFKSNANVWTTPMDVKGKMWIRRGLKPRKHWDWTEEMNKYGQVVRIWNQGDATQF